MLHAQGFHKEAGDGIFSLLLIQFSLATFDKFPQVLP